MRDTVRRHFNASTVIAVVALVFAMSGGAWATKRYLITSTGQIKPTVLKQLKGASGAKGVAGAAGPQGAAGAQGPQGPQGAPGNPGAPGKEGTEGKEGKKGEEGKPGQGGFTEALPAGKTETGTWALNVTAGATTGTIAVAPISFSIPVSGEGEAVFLNEAATAGKAGTGGCTGTVEAPTAPAGTLCLYTEEEETEKLEGSPHPLFNGELNKHGKPGGFLEFALKAAGSVAARGSWAVTG